MTDLKLDHLDESLARTEALFAAHVKHVEALRSPEGVRSAVDGWLGEIENFSLRSERLAEDVRNGAEIRPWLEAAFRLGVEAAMAPVPPEGDQGSTRSVEASDEQPGTMP